MAGRGYKVLPEREYEPAPDMPHTEEEGFRVEWFCNDEKVCEEKAWTFRAKEAGEFQTTVKVVDLEWDEIRSATVVVCSYAKK